MPNAKQKNKMKKYIFFRLSHVHLEATEGNARQWHRAFPELGRHQTNCGTSEIPEWRRFGGATIRG